uniref:E4 n=1 Tax=Angiostrongylus cantonensis TaxID=6313 RepID=A0A0K0CVR3_ANGCA
MPLTLLSELTRCWILGPLMCKLVAFLQRKHFHIVAYH